MLNNNKSPPIIFPRVRCLKSLKRTNISARNAKMRITKNNIVQKKK
jgi:hypothetical protein